MAKKSRRVKKRGGKASLSPAQMVQPGMGTDVPLTVTTTQSEPEVTDLREEYRYVAADLKRIGIIAGAMLAVLIALALLLP